MRLLPWVLGVKAQVGMRMEEFGQREPLPGKAEHVLPRYPALLAASL